MYLAHASDGEREGQLIQVGSSQSNSALPPGTSRPWAPRAKTGARE